MPRTLIEESGVAPQQVSSRLRIPVGSVFLGAGFPASLTRLATYFAPVSVNHDPDFSVRHCHWGRVPIALELELERKINHRCVENLPGFFLHNVCFVCVMYQEPPFAYCWAGRCWRCWPWRCWCHLSGAAVPPALASHKADADGLCEGRAWVATLYECSECHMSELCTSA